LQYDTSSASHSPRLQIEDPQLSALSFEFDAGQCREKPILISMPL
jgi:hypothetical protein